MKSLTLLIIAIFAITALSEFTPLSNFELSELEGTWYIQSVYDTTGEHWNYAYCVELTFNIIDNSTISFTITGFSGNRQDLNKTIFYSFDPTNPAILYEQDHLFPSMAIVNISALPYSLDGGAKTAIFALNCTLFSDKNESSYIVFGASNRFDMSYDVSPYIHQNYLPINRTGNFWYINTACDAHFGWNPVKSFNSSDLLGTWNLMAVYDPVNSGLVPWYTHGEIFNWKKAFCGQVSFNPGNDIFDFMTLSLQSVLEGNFTRTWHISPAPKEESVLMGFSMDEYTLLYVSAVDYQGNIVLTTGTTTSFLLSKDTSFTSNHAGFFFRTLTDLGYETNVDLIQIIDNDNCNKVEELNE